ncbi:MAG: response regulator transcription factor [Proteobacteria bacterium]|nr:response regulator transcription factor [Pseudomonadota bacterium]
MPKILIVEDDHSMAVALKDGFEFEGYSVDLAGDGNTALRLVREVSPDLVLLDVMLPQMSGLDVCKQLRQDGMNLPIIMLTARGQEIDKVLGLKLGADDYITKPFSFMELAARVEAVLRRTVPKQEKHLTYRFGNVVVDFKKSEVRKNNQLVNLSAREFRLLQYFIEHQGEVIERDMLLDAVWDHNNPPLTRTVDMHVAKLRKKLEDQTTDPRHFITVHRLGYKFVGDD